MKERLIKDLLALEEEIEAVEDTKAKARLKRKYNQITKILKQYYSER